MCVCVLPYLLTFPCGYERIGVIVLLFRTTSPHTNMAKGTLHDWMWLPLDGPVRDVAGKDKNGMERDGDNETHRPKQI